MHIFIKAVGHNLLSQSLLLENDVINLAINHEIELMKTWENEQSQLLRVETENNFPHVACSKYFDAHQLKETLSAHNISEYHVTYSSASDSLFCVIIYLTLQQHRSMTTIPAREVILMEPVPSILKFDRNIHALLQHLAFFLRPHDGEPVDTHLLRSILFSDRAGISIVFRNRTSLAEQQQSVGAWVRSALLEAPRKMFWSSGALQSHFQRRRDGSAALRVLHEEWRRWTSPPPSSSSSSCERETEQLLGAARHRHRSAYLPLPPSWLAALRGSFSAPLPEDRDGPHRAAACFAALISSLAADKRVARLVRHTYIHTHYTHCHCIMMCTALLCVRRS